MVSGASTTCFEDKTLIHQYSVICCEHFPQSDYHPFSRELKKDGVPSIFKFPEHLQNVKKERKPPKRHKMTQDECDDTTMLIKSQKTSNSSPTKESLKLQLAEQKVKIKVLQQKSRRKEKQLTKLKSIVHDMKKKNLISIKSANKLETHFSGLDRDIITNHEKIKIVYQ